MSENVLLWTIYSKVNQTLLQQQRGKRPPRGRINQKILLEQGVPQGDVVSQYRIDQEILYGLKSEGGV